MERFVKLSVLFLFIAGCASVQLPDYISRTDHAYDRKIYGSFDKVSGAVTYVLKRKGWVITTEALPSIYERDERYDNNGYRNLLIITDVKQSSRLVYSTFRHLNIFMHCLDNTCDVELRYEAKTPFTSTRNDQLANGILDAVQQEASK